MNVRGEEVRAIALPVLIGFAAGIGAMMIGGWLAW
jgi:MFS superfamily sulfate permease-like transporter